MVPTIEAIRARLADINRLLAELEATPAPPAPDVDQNSCSPVSRRTFLDAARRGDFPSTKRGRLTICTRADFDAYLAGRPRAPRALAAPVVFDVAASEARDVAKLRAKSERKLRVAV